MSSLYTLTFDHRFATLPEYFYTRMEAEKVGHNPRLIHANKDAAYLIDMDPACLHDPQFPLYFSGHLPLPGSLPLAMAYAGHQFGQYVPQLGDGRALLLGQVRNSKGELWDIQLKGSGKTPYSRFGDGRAVMRSCIREYLCSEAMAGLGIPTTRALAIVATHENVERERLEPGAILTRLALSHIRFGHFEYMSYGQPEEALELLINHVITTYFPHLDTSLEGKIAWFAEVVDRTAQLIAQWQAIGFAHGVMNTDNMSILGLTLDYGPFGFMERFDSRWICNHSDPTGRYAFDQQPAIAHWNLFALAHALSPAIPFDDSKEVLLTFGPLFDTYYRELMRQKLGFAKDDHTHDTVWMDLLGLMELCQADYTLTFRGLSEWTIDNDSALMALFHHSPAATDWLTHYRRVVKETDEPLTARQARMQACNPKYILRNWIAEQAIRAVEDRGDVSVLDELLTLFNHPFDPHPGHETWAKLPPKELEGLWVSCSS